MIRCSIYTMDDDTSLNTILGEFLADGEIGTQFDVTTEQKIPTVYGSICQNFITLRNVEQKIHLDIDTIRSKRIADIDKLRTETKRQLSKKHNECVLRVLEIVEKFKSEKSRIIDTYLDIPTIVDRNLKTDLAKQYSILDECSRVEQEMTLSERYNREEWDASDIETFCELFRTERPAYKYWNFDPVNGQWSFIPGGRINKMTIVDGVTFALINYIKPMIMYYHTTGKLDNAIEICFRFADNLRSLVLLTSLGYPCKMSHEEIILKRSISLFRDFYLHTIKSQIFSIVHDTDVAMIILRMTTGENIHIKNT